MAQSAQKDLISRLADAGEEAIAKLASVPGAERFLETANVLRARLDEVQKKLLGLEAIERRVDELERRVDQLSKGGSTTTARGPAKARSGPTRRTAKTQAAESDELGGA